MNMPSFRLISVLCIATASALYLAIAALRANEVMDFWREEWERNNRASTATPAPAQPRAATRPSTAARTKVTVWPKRKQEKREDREADRGGGKLYCVRTCDGFYFPANAGSSSAENSRICGALCPGAATEPYRIGSSDDIGDAVSPKGKPYTALPAAFSYRTSLKDGCACKRPAKIGFAALLDDATLAPNDIVVTERGIFVFVGGGRFPHRESDFIPYRKARGMERKVVAYLNSIDRLIPRAEAGRASDATRAAPAPKRSSRAGAQTAPTIASRSIDAPGRPAGARLTAAQETASVAD